MSSEIGNEDKIYLLIRNARFLGIELLPPDINLSEYKFTLVDDKIMFGLGAIKHIGINIIERILNEREANGAFSNIFELVDRVGTRLEKEALESLIDAMPY